MAIIANARDLGAFIRAERGARGLTQAALAASAGVGRQWLVEVEGGHDRAEFAHVTRVLSALGLAVTPAPTGSSNPTPTWYPVRAVAVLIRKELERGDTDFALRFLALCLSELDGLTGDLDDHLGEPPSTGDHRWDVLIAAAVRWRCSQRGHQAPGWTQVLALEEDWWPVHDKVLEARTRQRTPPELIENRIWLDSRSLSVL